MNVITTPVDSDSSLVLFVCDAVLVEEHVVAVVSYTFTITSHIVDGTVMSTDEYRSLINDYETSDALLQKQIQYIEGLCRSIIRETIYSYENNS